MYKLTKKGKIFIGIIVIIILIISYYFYSQKTEEDIYYLNNLDSNETEKKEIKTEKKEIIVHIAGCIAKPGIVKLEENSRICDAIDLAGGITEEADISKINLAYPLEDGMKIYIPNINEKEVNIENEYLTQETTTQEINSTINKKININSANKSEIETIPGIGSITAQKIIDYRKENGKFKKIEDIKNISGIGENKFKKIKEYICI